MVNLSCVLQPPQGGRCNGCSGFLTAFLEAIYPVPTEAEVIRTDYVWDRWTHADVPRMTNAELAAEERRLELRILLDPAPPDWLSDRLAGVRQERHRHGR